MPPPFLTSNCDASDAFHDQFSAIIRQEARLRGDNSEDVMGPGHKQWVVKHLKEVAQAQAQGLRSRLPTQASTMNEHAQAFVSPLSAQTTTPGHSGHNTPWYESFNLADQRVLYGSGLHQSPGLNTESPNLAHAQSSSGSNTVSQNLANIQSPYRPFDPAEVAAYRATVQAQLSQSNTQGAAVQAQPSQSSTHRAEQKSSTPSGHYYSYNTDPIYQTIQDDPRSQLPSALINNNAYAHYPSTPSNLPAKHPSIDSLSDLTTNISLHANTEPITRSAGMSFLTAPDHYKPFELFAFEAQVGDYIQSVMYPGEVLSIYAIEIHDKQAPGKRPIYPNDNLRIQWKGTDGTIRAKVFSGRNRVYVLRDEVKKEVKKTPKKKKKAGKKDAKKDAGEEMKKDGW